MRGARGAAIAAIVAIGALIAPAALADTPRSLEYWLDDYGFTTAWGTSTGAGVSVAVIDTGVDGSIAELSGVVTAGADFSGVGSADGTTPVGDDPSHGTLVASMLAGRGTGTDSGVIGVAPGASLLSASIGVGVEGATSVDDQIAAAVRWSVDNGAQVINLSLTRNSLQWPRSWDDAFQYAFDNDVVVVAAAGNRAGGTTEVGAPATIPGVLTVAGVDRDGAASFDASSQGITIAVAAPSEQLVGALPGGGYATWQGTSGAAPIVAGLAALVRAAHPELDAANVIERVVATARAVDGRTDSPIYGHGLIDAAAAVSAPVAAVAANPMGDLREWVRLHRRGASTEQTDAAIGPAPLPLPSAEADQARAAPIWEGRFWRDCVIPVATILGFVSLVVLGVIAATRQFKRALRR
ncbi:S8 family serine peptidase [Microbacteriaceae bacterium VKM Ac-2855]|nr:S8 family serine peptidase [Microbacteriaceae bacterium VKM Ac-2855]